MAMNHCIISCQSRYLDVDEVDNFLEWNLGKHILYVGNKKKRSALYDFN